MIVQASLFDLLTAVAAMLGIILAFGQILVGQLDKRLDDRFQEIDRQRKEGQEQARVNMERLVEQHERDSESLRNLWLEFNLLKASLPMPLVSRDEMLKELKAIHALVEKKAEDNSDA